jgi:hypothetical protein
MSDTVWGVLCVACAIAFFGFALWMNEERQSRMPREPVVWGPFARGAHNLVTRHSVRTAKLAFAATGLFFALGSLLFFFG